jgi:hypothetical protein
MSYSFKYNSSILVKCIITFALLAICFSTSGKSFVVISLKGTCSVEGKALLAKDTINISSTIVNKAQDPCKILIRELNSEKAYSFSLSGDKPLQEILNQKTNLREYSITNDIAMAAREVSSSSGSNRDIIYHNRIEFDIARIIVNGIGSASALEVSSPYDQYWWDLSIPEKDNNSLINIVNYNDIPLFICAVIVEDFNEREFTPLTNEAYIVKPMTKVSLSCAQKLYSEDTILLISSTENINPHVICEVLPIAEGQGTKLTMLGLNVFTM